MYDTEGEENRKAERYICNAGISINGFDGFAVLKNINMHGFCMASKTYITIAPHETLATRIIPEGVTGIDAFDLNVEVIWVKSTPILFTAGFLIKEKTDVKPFQQYIAHLKGGHSSASTSKIVFKWDDSLTTGNTLIDSEHKQLIQAINDFFTVCYNNSGGENLQKTINFMVDYTIKHFYDEEQLQIQYKYPGYDNHRKFHEGFKKRARDLMVGFIHSGPTNDLIRKAKHDIGEVLIEHIKREDTRLAAHIRGQQL
ncbi:MAG: hemerythrin family protein [Treponema sp.]|jgi:hemerythrin|nr:hemerythrin family protein [Treponema sp.]